MILLITATTMLSQSNKLITIVCQTDFDKPITKIKPLINDFGCPADYINLLSQELGNIGFELNQTSNTNITGDIYLITTIQDEQLILNIQSRNQAPLSPSNILHRHLENGLFVSLTDYDFGHNPSLIHITIGILLYDTAQCDLAESYFELSDNSDNEQLSTLQLASYFYMGNCTLLDDQNESIKNAIPIYKKGLTDTDLASIALNTNLAWAYIQTGDKTSAFDLFDQLYDELEKDTALSTNQLISYLSSRAQLYALTFDYTSAIQDMDQAIIEAETVNMSKEDVAELYKLRGDIIMLIYEWNRALENYNIAIELNSDYAEAYYRRGILLYTMVEREEAITNFETYLELEENGHFADSATGYIDSIQTELNALGG